jgi:octopine/nopaline transport system permease protein
LFFGLFLGLLFAILRLNKNILINKFAYGYSYVFRGTPLLVQIFIIYFGLGQIEYLRSTFLWVILKEPYWCAIIAFTFKYRRLHIRDIKISISNNKTRYY